jgi:hypothetical protein|tara:strand:+ start:6297 stop:7043 length:747 start_codon:yes stop_codon:yes gene_type:complete
MPNRPQKTKKIIYKFSVDKKTTEEVENVRKNKETGEEEKVITKKPVNKPVKFVVKKPSRRLVDESEVFYSVELSKCIKQGIVTKAMLQKKYADTGGSLTEDQSKELLRAVKRSNDIASEYQLIKAVKGKEEEAQKLEEELLDLRKRMIDLEATIQTEYQFTADSRAERNLILWYVINLTRVVENKEEKQYFDGIDFDEQLEDLYKKDESDGFDAEVLDILYKVVSYWYYNQNLSEKDIENLLKQNEGS